MSKNNILTTFDVIRQHLFDPNNYIELDPKQEEIMKRWNYVIELRTCESLKTKDIVIKLMETYGVERATAMNDIGNAEALYGYSTPLNKRYRIGARIEYIEEKIDTLYNAKEYVAAAMLEKSLASYYDMYPELKKQEAPRNFTFIYNQPDKPLIEDLPTIETAIEVLTNE